jgi:prevent-host-death family protein
VTVTVLARNFSALVDAVRRRGVRLVVTKGGVPVAELRPAGSRTLTTCGEFADAWDALPKLEAQDAAAFGRDIDAARRQLSEPRDAWA